MLFSKLFKSDTQSSDVAKRVADRRLVKPRIQRGKIDSKKLRIGMVVVRLDKPWEESAFPFQRVEIKSRDDILAVQRESAVVIVEFATHTPEKPKAGSTSQRTRRVVSNTVDVTQELEVAVSVHSMASTTVKSFLDDIRLGEEPDASLVKQAVTGCVDSILRNQDASLWLTRIQAKDASSAQHSMNVSALSIIMGKAMGMNNKDLEDIGVCGMLHDVGKTRIASELIDKRTALQPEDIAELKRHTIYGRDILLSTKNVMSGAADVAYSHHERPDGKGYPQGLVDDQIPVYSKVIAIANAYDKMTMARNTGTVLSPSQAIQKLYTQRGKQFDDELVILFIDAIGIFPPGSIVEMVNNEVGIVLSNTTDKLRPRVIIILDSLREPAMQRIVDLSRMETDPQGKLYQIKETHNDGAFGINVGEFQRAGLRIG